MKKDFATSSWPEVHASKQASMILKWPVQMVETHKMSGQEVLCLCVMKQSVKGIIPMPESGIEPSEEFHVTRSKFNAYLGTDIHFVVTNIDTKGDKFIASRRIAINRLTKKLKLRPGDVREAVALRELFHGSIIVDIAGIEALLPISEISHAWVEETAKFIQPGDTFDVKVLSIEDKQVNAPIVEGRQGIIEIDKDIVSIDALANIKTTDQISVAEPDKEDGEVESEEETDETETAVGSIETEDIDESIEEEAFETEEGNDTEEVKDAVVKLKRKRKEPTRKWIKVSIKALIPDPRPLIPKYYKADSACIGTVTGLIESGVFVALEPYEFGVTAFCAYGMGYGYEVIVPQKGDTVTLACRTINKDNRIYGQILKILRKAN